MQSIAVGGGITGVTTPCALARRGFAVTRFEKNRYAAMETSFANGGQLSASNAEVWSHGSTILKGLKWLLESDVPLRVNPKPGWDKLSRFVEFTDNIPHYQWNTVESARLAIAAREHLLAWAQAERVDFDLKQEGLLHNCRDKRGLDHAGKVSRMLAQGGLARRAVTRTAMKAIEPTLAGDCYGSYFTGSDSTGDIHTFTTGMALAAERLGVHCRYGQDVQALHSDGKTVEVPVADADGHSTHRFDGRVVCAGVESRNLAAQLGDRVNIYPVKGYAITVHLPDARSQSAAPVVSLLDHETQLVTSRLGLDRFRVAGTAEFNGYNKDIRADRTRPRIAWVTQCFPGINTRQVVPWAGLRPMMPNMMPRVGRGQAANVFYNTGRFKRLLTDNGPAYRSVLFSKTCSALGIKHSFTRPCRPQTNGKA